MSPSRATRTRVVEILCAAIAVVVATVVAATAFSVLADWVGTWRWVLFSLAVMPAAGVLAAIGPVRRHSDLILRWAAIGLSLVLAVGVGAFVAALVSGRLPKGIERDVVAPGLVGAAVSCVAFALIRPVARRLAGLLRHGDERQAEDVVRHFAERSSRGASEDDLLDLADSLRRTMGVRAAEIWQCEDTVLRRVSSSPNREGAEIEIGATLRDLLSQSDVVGPAWLGLWLPALLDGRTTSHLRAVPAAHFGDLLGLVIVERNEDESFSSRDDTALIDLGRRLGSVLGNLQLDSALRKTLTDLRRANEELRASRTRLVAAADAERRRIERDLHDGAQQQLVALAINIKLARNELPDQPNAAIELLDDLAKQTHDTIDAVRELAHGIYPPALARGGLSEALYLAVSRHPGNATLDTGTVGRYEPQLEAAVYYCCLEALQNVAKHAPDANVTVKVDQAGETLEFSVADDGPGFQPGSINSGHGFENMTDRVGAIGGSVTWETSPGGGVRVVGSVPVREVA